MNRKHFSVISKFLIILFFSLIFFVSCSDTTPHISSLHKTLIYEFPSEDEEAQVKLSVFINPSQDIRRAKTLEILHPETNFVWKIDNPQIYQDNKKYYFGCSALTVPTNFDFPEGLFELTYFDVADRSIKENFEVNLLTSMLDKEDSPSKKRLKRILSQIGVDLTYDLIEIKRCDNSSQNPKYYRGDDFYKATYDMLDEIINGDECFSIKDLKINGNDLIAIGFKGKDIGKALQKCLDGVIAEKVQNNFDDLIKYAKK